MCVVTLSFFISLVRNIGKNTSSNNTSFISNNTNIDNNSNDNYYNDNDIWSEPAPQHLLPTLSPNPKTLTPN